MMTTVAEALATRPFSYMIELVASGLKREAQVLEIASNLATIPDVIAGSITSYAGGRFGQDPVRVGTAVRARGLTPNIHLTCVDQDRAGVRKTLRALRALGIFNIFAITGDWPMARGSTPVFDLDSVQLIELIDEVRTEQNVAFHISCAVSPFKYYREDCLYQYLKLEKKIRAGANFAITQVGWDARKFKELKTYLDERGLKIPLFGNVYVLGLRAAEKMSTGSPPGCWASPELVADIRKESEAPDKGLAARLERAAKSVAVLKGLGYAGAYIGGTHDAVQVNRIIQRARELEPQWEQCYEELQYGDRNGFYLENETQAPARHKTFLPMVLDLAGQTLPLPWAKDKTDTPLRRSFRAFFAWVDSKPALREIADKFEYWGKRPVFGCEACGNCVLGHMEYVCPQTCPKQMRNGPCGGTFMSRCEVVDQECIWVKVYQRAEAAARLPELRTFIPAPDRKLLNTSSWINFYLERDSRPGHPKPVDAATAPDVPVRKVDHVREPAPSPTPSPKAPSTPERERKPA